MGALDLTDRRGLTARFAWLVEMAPLLPPEVAAAPPATVAPEAAEGPSCPVRWMACPALGNITTGACVDLQDEGGHKPCMGCQVGAMKP